MTPSEFADHFKSLDNAALWEVLQSRNRYQPAAIQAAEAEWTHRQLDEETVTSLANNSIARKNKVEQEIAEKLEQESQAKKDVLDFFLREKEEETKVSRVAQATGAILAVFILITLIQYFDAYLSMVTDFLYEPVNAFVFFLPIVIGVLGCIRLIRLKQSGWYLTMIFVGLSFSFTASSFLLYIWYGAPDFSGWIIHLIKLAISALPEVALIWLGKKYPFRIPKSGMAATIAFQIIFLLYIIYNSFYLTLHSLVVPGFSLPK